MSLVKTKEEIEILRKGGKRLAQILADVSERVLVGANTKELDDYARKLADKEGDRPAFLGYTPAGAGRPYPAALCVSVSEEVVHGVPNEPGREILDGDILTLDMGLEHQGMITDMAVTVGAGPLDDTAMKLIEVAREARSIAINQARPGNTTGDIGSAVEKYVNSRGFSVAHELGGHGVGHAVHEDPFIPNVGHPGTGEELIPGMVIAIEPIICEGSGDIVLDKVDGYTYRTKDGKRSAQFEHTVLITQGEPEILTKI